MSPTEPTYEESIQWLRSRPELEEFIRLCYLDEDNLAAAQRFAASEEFIEVAHLLSDRFGSRPLRILDVGCGNGIVAYAFASLGHHVEGIDPEPSDDIGLGAAKRLAQVVTGGSIRLTQAVVEDLPFAEGSFDVVYTRQAVHHFQDLEAGLQSCYRVLRPGGILLATREHVVDDDEQLQQFLRDHMVHQLCGGENAYPLETYLATLGGVGFRQREVFGHYDTVINHFPESNQALLSRYRAWMRGQLGPFRFLMPVVKRIDYFERAYRRRLSAGYNLPGRLYSFLCTK